MFSFAGRVRNRTATSNGVKTNCATAISRWELRHLMKHPGRFDAFGVAAKQGVVAGRFDAAALPRVADLLAEVDGAQELAYRITGTADPQGRPALEVALSGAVPLVCQRCLQSFLWPVEQSTLLLLARDEAEAERLDAEDHEHEVVLAAEPIDPRVLVEDELVLTLPFVPRCPEEQCPAGKVAADVEPLAPTRPALAALAELRGTGGGRRRTRR